MLGAGVGVVSRNRRNFRRPSRRSTGKLLDALGKASECFIHVFQIGQHSHRARAGQEQRERGVPGPAARGKPLEFFRISRNHVHGHSLAPLSTVFDSADRARCSGQTVRVIDYALQGLATPGQDRYRLVTNLLDPQAAPALELAALYHERWEIEGVFDEFKTHLRGHSTVLRSKTPELVQQELWGLLLAHFAVRQLMTQAAWPRGLDPDRLSFTHAVRVIKRKMPQAAAVPP